MIMIMIKWENNNNLNQSKKQQNVNDCFSRITEFEIIMKLCYTLKINTHFNGEFYYKEIWMAF